MSVYKDVLGKIAPFMKSKGFLRSGYSGKFYYVENDIAYCITFDKPSAFIHVHAYIMPLYIPTKFVNFTYGNRLSYMKGLQIPEISEDKPEYIEEWCDTFCSAMENVILPIFKKIGTPEALVTKIEENDLYVKRFLFTPPEFIERLKMYTYLYLQRIPETEKAIECYRNELTQMLSSTTKECHEFYYESTNVVEALLHEDKDKRDAFVKSIIDHTKTFFKNA